MLLDPAAARHVLPPAGRAYTCAAAELADLLRSGALGARVVEAARAASGPGSTNGIRGVRSADSPAPGRGRRPTPPALP